MLDVTPRKRDEDALRDSEARHRAILETTVDGIITIDDRGERSSRSTRPPSGCSATRRRR